MKSISPIVLSRASNNKKEYILYNQDSNAWLEALKRNISKRTLSFLGKEIEPESVKALGHGNGNLVIYQKAKIPARYMSLEIKGPVEMLETIVYSGIGERTGSGFGMVFPF